MREEVCGKVAGCSLLFKPANNTQGKLLPQLSHSQPICTQPCAPLPTTLRHTPAVMTADTVSGETYRAGLLHRHATSVAARAKKGCMRSRAEAPCRVVPDTCAAIESGEGRCVSRQRGGRAGVGRGGALVSDVTQC